MLSLRGRKDSQGNAGASSSTRLYSGSSNLSPGHELDEIAVVSGSGTAELYGSLSQQNGPSLVPGEWTVGELINWGGISISADYPRIRRTFNLNNF